MNALMLVAGVHIPEKPHRPFATVSDARVGDQHAWSKTYYEEDRNRMGDAIHDHNPIHYDHLYASKTRFKRPILHGVSGIGEISRALGMDFPGRGSIFVELNIRFKGAVYPGDTVHYVLEIIEIDVQWNKLKLSVVGAVNGRPVITGDTVILLGDDPESDE